MLIIITIYDGNLHILESCLGILDLLFFLSNSTAVSTTPHSSASLGSHWFTSYSTVASYSWASASHRPWREQLTIQGGLVAVTETSEGSSRAIASCYAAGIAALSNGCYTAGIAALSSKVLSILLDFFPPHVVFRVLVGHLLDGVLVILAELNEGLEHVWLVGRPEHNYQIMGKYLKATVYVPT